jgi:hypothetical protein
MSITLITTAYIIYLPIVITLTWYVAHTLFANAKVFMLDIFNGKEAIAMSTNKLFEVGFYLINIGFAFLIMKISEYNYGTKPTTQGMFETLSTKIGGFAIYLGIMLFANLFLFFRGRKISRMHGRMGEQVPASE